MKYHVSCEFVAPYLQHRFSDEAKADLAKKAGVNVQDLDDNQEMIIKFSYQDEKGYYIPRNQLLGMLDTAGQMTKKKPRGSMKQLVMSFVTVDDQKVYLNKTKCDYTEESYPKRKDGNRVHIVHPVFEVGTKFEFTINVSDDNNLNQKTIEQILKNGGEQAGLGARRPRNGRFKVLKLEAI